MCLWKKLFCTVLLSNLPLAAQDVVMIINPGNETQSLTTKDLQKIYMNKRSRWSSGDHIVSVTLESGAVHESFLRKYLRKDKRQFSTFWKRLLFTGKGVPPTSFANEEEVVAFVAKTPGAIGYVSAKANLKGVVVVPIQNDS
ncbi:MAG: substrate-binding domain-containing protein [Acidobacteriota bacterium]|nr:substrate-binding domain-containing protein [Acidobacteriota bacterium]